MLEKFNFLLNLIKYKVFAPHHAGHGVHSPFVFNFITEVLEDKRYFYAYEDIEFLREDLSQSVESIEVDDFGAGSKTMKSKKRRISSIVKNSAIAPKYGQLLFRIVNHFRPKTIVELGTSLGISTLYLAKNNPETNVYTIEGCKQTAKIAEKSFTRFNIKNTIQHIGKFDKILPNVLEKIETVDLAFIDGNHRFEPTLKYFELFYRKLNKDSILIFDDIHWNKDMEKAWEKIKNDSRVTISIDLFFIGIVFFCEEMPKQNFVIRF